MYQILFWVTDTGCWVVFVMQEYETVMKGLDRNAPSVPPQNSPQEAQQVEMWKKYIQWEKSNPLRTEDQTLITKRGKTKCNVKCWWSCLKTVLWLS